MLRLSVLIMICVFLNYGKLQSQSVICDAQTYQPTSSLKKTHHKSSIKDTVYVHFFVAHDLFTSLGSDINVVDSYVRSMFDQVIDIYALSDIYIDLIDISIWTQPDPYDLTDINQAITSFRASHTSQHSGHLAHLLTSAPTVHGAITKSHLQSAR